MIDRHIDPYERARRRNEREAWRTARLRRARLIARAIAR